MSAESSCDRRLRAAFDAHGDRLLRVLSQSGLGEGDAEDIVQDALCVLARRLGDVPEHAERAFLVGTALRLASALKRSVWHRRVSEPFDPDLHALPALFGEMDFDARAGQALLPAALAALAEEDRTVFVLGELEELTRAEIASALSMPAGTVATRLARGRADFERALRRAKRETPSSLPPGSLASASSDSWDCRDAGGHRYENNSFGAARARGHFEQRLVTRRREARAQTGWTWRWPGLDAEAFAFPEVVAGWKPWHGGTPTDPVFPLRIERARRLLLHYDTEIFALGSYNLAADLWLIDAATATFAANPHLIATEVMVILDHSRGARPPGTLRERVTIDGGAYELWHAEGTGASMRGGRGWRLLSFRSEHAAPRGTLDLKAFLLCLVGLGLARPEQSVASVELGNEIMGGAGTTWIARFEVEAIAGIAHAASPVA